MEASFERWLGVVVASLEATHRVPRGDLDQLVERHDDSLRALHQGRIAPVTPIKWLYYEWRAEFAAGK